MPDQHDTSAFVVVLEVIVPRVKHIVVSKHAINLHRPAGNDGSQSRQSDLPVQRGIGPTHRTESSKLRADNRFLFRTRHHIAVAGRVVRYRRIHIEAINRCVRIWRPVLPRELAICRDHCGAQVDRARILSARPAQPRLALAVVVLDCRLLCRLSLASRLRRICVCRSLGLARLRASNSRSRQNKRCYECDNRSAYHLSPPKGVMLCLNFATYREQYNRPQPCFSSDELNDLMDSGWRQPPRLPCCGRGLCNGMGSELKGLC